MEHSQIEKRKQKITNWLKNPYNLALVAILIFAFAIRLYYFNLTNTQGVWWDEGEYLAKAKNIAFGTSEAGWWWARPVLLPLLFAFVFKIGLGELTLRFLYVIISTLSVFFVYLISKEVIKDKLLALVPPFLMSAFWLEIFLTQRLLTEVPLHFLIIISVYFYLKGIKNFNYNLYLAAFFSSLAFLMKWTAGVLLPVFVIHAFFMHGKKVINKKIIYAALIGIFIVGIYFLYNHLTFGGALAPIKEASSGFGVNVDPETYSWQKSLSNQIGYMKDYFGIFNFIILLSSFLFLLSDFYLYGRKFRKSHLINISLIFLMFFFYVGFFVRIFTEDNRHIFPAFFSMAILISYSFDRLTFWLGKYKKIIYALAVISLFLSAYYSLPYANNIVTSRSQGYGDLRDAGLWLKDNTIEEEKILSAAIPELTYYSGREVLGFIGEPQDTLALIEENNIRFMVLTVWEKHAPWVDDKFINDNFRLAQQYENTVILEKIR